MTLGELISAWREDERDNVTPYLFSHDHLMRLFNEAQQEAAARGDLLRVTVTIAISPGDFEIDLQALGDVDSDIAEVRTARIVEGGVTHWLSPTDRYEQDRIFRDWRDTTSRPTAYIHDDTSITLNRIVETAANLLLECIRMPIDLADDDDELEIAKMHHRHLAGWVRYRAYSVPDADFFDMNKAMAGLADFEGYFGRRKDVDYRRNNNANRPHRVKVCI